MRASMNHIGFAPVQSRGIDKGPTGLHKEVFARPHANAGIGGYAGDKHRPASMVVKARHLSKVREPARKAVSAR